MAKIKVVLNRAGVREMLCSKEAQAICEEYAHNAVSRLGPDYEVQKRNYPERRGVAILPMTYQAKKDELENNTILKNLR